MTKTSKIPPLKGHHCIVHQEGGCGGRPTLIGRRLAARRCMGRTREQALQHWQYADPRKIDEAIRFIAEHRKRRQPLAREAAGKE